MRPRGTPFVSKIKIISTFQLSSDNSVNLSHGRSRVCWSATTLHTLVGIELSCAYAVRYRICFIPFLRLTIRDLINFCFLTFASLIHNYESRIPKEAEMESVVFSRSREILIIFIVRKVYAFVPETRTSCHFPRTSIEEVWGGICKILGHNCGLTVAYFHFQYSNKNRINVIVTLEWMN